MAARVRRFLYLLAGVFVIGMLMVTTSNQQVRLRVLAYHACWHLVSAFGFVVLWAFNHVRFVATEQSQAQAGARML